MELTEIELFDIVVNTLIKHSEKNLNKYLLSLILKEEKGIDTEKCQDVYNKVFNKLIKRRNVMYNPNTGTIKIYNGLTVKIRTTDFNERTSCASCPHFVKIGTDEFTRLSCVPQGELNKKKVNFGLCALNPKLEVAMDNDLEKDNVKCPINIAIRKRNALNERDYKNS